MCQGDFALACDLDHKRSLAGPNTNGDRRKEVMRRPVLSLRCSVLSIAIFGALLSLSAANLYADEPANSDFVYVMTNKVSNSVIQYSRSANGALTRLREVPTGGKGTGATQVDPLGSQDSLVLSGDGHLLLAANAASNEITVFQIQNGILMWQSKVRSGGDFPNSIALFGDLVYVLNSKGGTPNITGFRLDPDGNLHQFARVALPAGAAGANDIRFSPDGIRILVTVSGTNQILVFEVANNGVAGSAMPETSAGASPFGVRFGRGDVTVISEAAGSASSYDLTGADLLDVISGAVSDMQKASCWISLTRDARFAFVSDTGSGTVSSFSIDSNGSLSLVQAVAANPGGAPIDSSLSRDSRFFYVLDSAKGRILLYSVNGSSLSSLGQISSLPTSIQGIAAQ